MSWRDCFVFCPVVLISLTCPQAVCSDSERPLEISYLAHFGGRNVHTDTRIKVTCDNAVCGVRGWRGDKAGFLKDAGRRAGDGAGKSSGCLTFAGEMIRRR